MIGFLSDAPATSFVHLIATFREGLSEAGYVEGRNVAFEHRAAGSEYDQFRILSDDMVRRLVSVIFAMGGNTAALAAEMPFAVGVLFSDDLDGI